LIGAAVLAALVFLTWRQSTYWRNTITLFTRVVTVDARNYAGYNVLGVDFLLRHKAAEAVPLFRRALEIWPAHLDSRFNLGLALAELGDTDEAMEQFSAVLSLNPRDAESLFNLGQALLKKGLPGEALQRFEAALALDPDQPAILLARGVAQERLGRMAGAADDFRRAVELDPGNAEARDKLERALRIPGR
jgi:tetratricopeptide (TPR) repeat protein